VSISIAANYAPGSASKWAKRGTATLLAGAIFLSAPAAVRSAGSSSVGSTSQVVSVVAVTAAKAVTLTSAATTVAPLPAPAPAQEVQKRFNIGPLMNWIWNSARWLWGQMANAVARGWSAFIGWWNGIPGWVRGTISFFVQGGLWDLFIEARRYFFGW